MSWYPEIATPAFYDMVNLRKIIIERQRLSRATILEPSSTEFIAALAAGMNARHILQVGCGLSTVALAVAARCTGTCVISVDSDSSKQEIVQQHIRSYGLSEHVRWICEDPLEYVPRRENVEFAYISGPTEIYANLFDLLKFKSNAVIVADNALFDSTNEYIKHVREQPGIDSTTIFVGRGIEISKIISWEKFRKGRKMYNRSASNKLASVLSLSKFGGTSSNASSSNALNYLSIGSDTPTFSSFGKDLKSLLTERESERTSLGANPVKLKAALDTLSKTATKDSLKSGLENAEYQGLIKREIISVNSTTVLGSPEVAEISASVQKERTVEAEEIVKSFTPPSDIMFSGDLRNHGNMGYFMPRKEMKHFAVQVDMSREDLQNGTRTPSASSWDSESYSDIQKAAAGSLVSSNQIRDSRGTNEDGDSMFANRAYRDSPDAVENTDTSPPVYQVNFKNDLVQTEITIEGVDQDMLLTDITLAFNETGVSVRRARIATQDKHVEDVFYCVDGRTQAPIDVANWEVVRQRILKRTADRKLLNGIAC